MKKNILIILMLVPVLGFISACKKSSFDDKYYNPEKTTKGTIDGLYTGIFKNRRVFPDYWNLFTFVSTTMGSYTQTTATFSDGRRYEQASGYLQDRWDDFYTPTGGDGNWTAPLPNYREMQRLYNALESDAEKQGYQLFMQTARIFLYDQTTQMVDMWGDIPFSEAGSLNLTGELKLPAYDKASEIYDSALINLKSISQWLATVQPEQFYLNKLSKQDILLKGDIMKWRRYANSLMLRLAMRISNVDETRARTLVQEILGNPTLYPVLNDINDNVQLAAGKPDLLTNLVDAFGQNRNYAPDYMVDSLLDPSADPRLRFLYTKNKNGIFQGLPKTMNRTQQDSMITNKLVSVMDSATFVSNQFFPGIVFTVAEVNFLKAEAYERWGGGSAKTYYDLGIRQSIAYFYKIHTLSDDKLTHQTPPTENEIVLLLAHPLVAYGVVRETNLNKIGLQKWVNFHVMQNNQAWAEMRRSGYPKLWFPVDNTSPTTPVPGFRLQYPANERSRNAENYAKVADKDKVYAKPFWMP